MGRGYNKNCVLYPRPLTCQIEFLLFYMCQLWALHVVIQAIANVNLFTTIRRRRPGAVQSVCPGVQQYKCLHNMAPGYLSGLCQPVSGVPGRRHLRSAGRGELDFLRVNLSTYGGRAFAYAGPTSWNSLSDNLKNVNLSLQSFKRHLKTFFFFSY